MQRILRIFLLVCLIAPGWPAAALAQAPADDPAARAPIRLGPLSITPTFKLTNLGIDNNVLLEETTPVSDFTFTATPGAKTWLRLGDGMLSGHTTGEWVYYATLASQRSFNLGQTLRFEYPLASITPRVAAEYLNTRERPNSEIDAFVRRRTTGFSGGVRARLTPLSSLDFEIGRSRWEYADTTVSGVRVRDSLDRTTSRWIVTFRQDLTPLTTLAARVDRERTEFPTAPERDGDAWSVSPGLEFQPTALLSGTAFVGYQRFTPRLESAPEYSGPIARVDLRYLLRETTSAGVTVDRHLEFSYSPVEPYYVSTSFEVVIRQAVAADWDVVGRWGRERMAYARFEGLAAPALFPDRHEHVEDYGIGAGYWLSFEGRIGVELSYATRESVVPGRSYRGFKFGGSFGYGF